MKNSLGKAKILVPRLELESSEKERERERVEREKERERVERERGGEWKEVALSKREPTNDAVVGINKQVN